jgi:hypothetical protein
MPAQGCAGRDVRGVLCGSAGKELIPDPSDDFTFSERQSQLAGPPALVLFFRRTDRRGREVWTKLDREG